MSKAKRLSFLIGILLIAVFLRFYHFTSTPPGLYQDEAMDGNNAVEAAETNQFKVFYVEDNGREGLYINIIAAIEKVTPIYEPWIVRLPAAVAGVLTVWGLYLLVAELFSPEAGLTSAFLVATSFWHIMFSRIGFRAILAPMLLAWALYLFYKSITDNSKSRALLYSIAAGIFYGLGFYTYIAFRITPLLFLLFIPFFRKLPGFWQRTTAFITTIFVVAAPIGLYFLKNPQDFFGRTAQISVSNNPHPLKELTINLIKTAAMFNIKGDYNWRHNIRRAPELFLPVGLLFILGFALAAWFLYRTWRKKQLSAENKQLFPFFGVLLTFAWFIFGGMPAAASDESIPHSLRSILMLPPAMIFATLGGMWLYQIIQKRWSPVLSQSLAVVFFAVVGIYGYYAYFIRWARDPEVTKAFDAAYVETGRQINALPAGIPKYVVVNAKGYMARGMAIPAQPTMFITHSFTEADAAAANIHYFMPSQIGGIPKGTPSKQIFYLEDPLP